MDQPGQSNPKTTTPRLMPFTVTVVVIAAPVPAVLQPASGLRLGATAGSTGGDGFGEQVFASSEALQHTGSHIGYSTVTCDPLFPGAPYQPRAPFPQLLRKALSLQLGLRER